MEGFPYVLVFIFPFFMFELNNKNFFTRIIFSNIRLSIIVLFLIFLVLLLGASIFYMKEKFAYSWKIRGRELYDKYKNTFDNNPIDYYLSVEGKFILLSADSILYYYKMGNRDGKNILFDIIMDKSTNKEELVIAEKAELRHQEIFFEKGKIVKLNNNLINKNYINFFSKYKVQIFADLENIFLGRAELKYLNTKTIFQFLRHLEKYEERSLKYIRNILLGRIMPNAIGFIIILFQAFLFLFFYQKHQFYVALLLSSFGLIIISSAVSLVSL
jgi:hypothetical protein